MNLHHLDVQHDDGVWWNKFFVSLLEPLLSIGQVRWQIGPPDIPLTQSTEGKVPSFDASLADLQCQGTSAVGSIAENCPFF